MNSSISRILLGLALTGYTAGSWSNVNLADTSQIITINATPNILLIPDTSETMQEGLSQGRIALDWTSGNCIPGTTMPASCIAGARNSQSKASIVKRVSLSLVDNFAGRVNMGLLSYQQYPPSENRDDVFSTNAPRSVLWFLTHRPLDVRYSTTEFPSWYDANHTNDWDSATKRFKEKHPTLTNTWMFYNVAVPGYYRDNNESKFPPQATRNQFARAQNNYSCNNLACESYDIYNSMKKSSNQLSYDDKDGGNWRITFTDSMRGRGVTDLGRQLAFLNTGQLEWRANASPGPGYLHVPIGGLDSDGKIVNSHWQKIRNKLQPQRHDWNSDKGNIFVNESWPLIASGLKPLEGTMHTARDYFLAKSTNFFGTNQGNHKGLPKIPESCGNNAVIWITDGLPSVSANGTALGTNPVSAMQQARTAVKDFYDKTAAESKLKGAVKTYIVGFALPPGVKQLFENESWFPASGNVLDYLAAAGGTGQAYSATDEAQLLASLESIFQNIIRDSISSSGLSSTSTELRTDTKIFQSEMNTINWSGDLLALNLVGGSRDRNAPAWRAASKLSQLGHANRKIFSNYGSDKFAFTRASTPTAVKNLLKTSSEALSVAENRIDYIRGNQSNEGTTAGKFRPRVGLLGHIVNSTPLFVAGEGARPPMLYIMANDGMLHAFNANTGLELFAYIPGAVLPRFIKYSSDSYAGEFMLDGQLAYKKIGNKLYLTGTGGTGVKSVFALDISNPTNFQATDILWEQAGDGAYNGLLGRTGSQPILAELNTQPVLLIGNGYNSQAAKSALLAINLLTGALQQSFEVTGSGFGSPGALDLDRNSNPDFIYIGDFNGKLWRFALDTSLASSGNYSASRHVFTSDNNRPLVVAPVAASHPDGGVMVIFGSGELLTNGSRISTTAEFVYGIRDKFDGGSEPTINSNQLVLQTLSGSGSQRNTSRNPITADKAGWRLQLPGGERLLANAVIRRQKVLFGSYKPDNTDCSGGGQGYMTELALYSGTPVSLTEPASKPVAGIPRTPIFIEIPPGGVVTTTPGCSPNCPVLADDKEITLIGEQDELRTVVKGRQSWREIGR